MGRAARAAFDEPGERPAPPEEMAPAKRNLIYGDGPRVALQEALIARDAPCLLFLCWGAGLAVLNVAGATGVPVPAEDYDQVLAVGVALAFLSCSAGLAQAFLDAELADNRPGIASEALLVGFYAFWGLAAAWLCARLGAGHGNLPDVPAGLEALDVPACLVCFLAFAAGAAAPLATVARHGEAPAGALSALEVYRMFGLAACGLPGALYMIDAASLALGGARWWLRVAEAWPAQRPCEQTTLLCGALAVEACMLLHRLGREGALRFRGEAVPAGVALCVLLTAVPTAAQIYWHRSEISLWEFYFV